MKKISLIVLFAILYNVGYSQFPVQQTQATSSTQVTAKGAYGSDSGYVYKTSFADTTALNRGFLKNISGITVRIGDDLWMRNNLATQWRNISNTNLQNIYAENGLIALNDSTLNWGGRLNQNTTISAANTYSLTFDSLSTGFYLKSLDNKKATGYENYGGRGIIVCDRWLHSFENFLLDMGEKPTPKHSLDRIDVNGNYCPENCRWATIFIQSRNKKKRTLFTYKNESLCIADWSIRTGIKVPTLEKRLRILKWDIEKALTSPIDISYQRIKNQ